MAYIGNIPAVQYASFSKQTLTADSSTTSFTLDNAVANENELEVFVNNVRQEPGSGKAYTASGTTLTMSAAPTTGDSFYVIFQGKATQTITAPAGSVTTSQLADSSVTNAKITSSIINSQTAETSIAGGDEVLIYDTSASALRKMTRTNFVSGVGGNNTPAFHAYRSSGQSLSSATATKIQFDTEVFDTDGCYDNATNYRFTPTTAGKYYCYAIIDSSWTGSVGGHQNETHFRKNGSNISSTNKNANFSDFYNGANLDMITSLYLGGVIDFNGSSDYLEIFHYSNASTPSVSGVFGAYKLIGV